MYQSALTVSDAFGSAEDDRFHFLLYLLIFFETDLFSINIFGLECTVHMIIFSLKKIIDFFHSFHFNNFFRGGGGQIIVVFRSALESCEQND
jgi:hypothetical protein